jgi:hypothetical protein
MVETIPGDEGSSLTLGYESATIRLRTLILGTPIVPTTVWALVRRPIIILTDVAGCAT